MAEQPRYRRNPAVDQTAVDDELFLVEPDSQEVFHLDALSGALWRLLAEPRSEAEIRRVYQAAFPDADAATIARDLRAALDELIRRNLAVITR